MKRDKKLWSEFKVTSDFESELVNNYIPYKL